MSKKKKKQASVDPSQMGKLIGVCVLVVLGIYGFNSLGGGSGAGNTVVSLAPGGNAAAPAPAVPAAGQPQQNAPKEKANPATDNKRGDTHTDSEEEVPGKSFSLTPSGPMESEGASEGIEPPKEELDSSELAALVQPAVVKVHCRGTKGECDCSGFVVSKTGLLLTSYHSLEGARDITVSFSNGSEVRVVGYKLVRPEFNLAMLQIAPPKNDMNTLSLTKRVPVESDQVVAFSGVKSSEEGALSSIHTQTELRQKIALPFNGTWLSSSVQLSEEMSGGPLVNKFGEVVAINMLRVSAKEEKNLALASSDLTRLVQEAGSRNTIPLSPEKFTGLPAAVKRRTAKNVSGTERGNRLLAQLTQVVVKVNDQRSHSEGGLSRGSSMEEPEEFDLAPIGNEEGSFQGNPRGRLSTLVQAHVKIALSAAKIEVLTESVPGSTLPELVIKWKMVPTSTAPNSPATVFVEGQLVGVDSKSEYVVLWELEEAKIGTVLPQALEQGRVPRTLTAKLTSTFGKLRSAHSRAKRSLK